MEEGREERGDGSREDKKEEGRKRKREEGRSRKGRGQTGKGIEGGRKGRGDERWRKKKLPLNSAGA